MQAQYDSFRSCTPTETARIRCIREWRNHALALVSGKKYKVSHNGLIWGDPIERSHWRRRDFAPIGGARTFAVVEYDINPWIIRLSIDQFAMVYPWHNVVADPTRRKQEITVLPEEVDIALPWAMAAPIEAPPPFEIERQPYVPESRFYLWSARANALYRECKARQKAARERALAARGAR
ncbi:MAG TPA: hypothetical protein VE987_13280 [Polyangiaceae bacterium]|nr:hypothetical protein [Polyangiaceae bacterium]